jgi:hypothetical protein
VALEAARRGSCPVLVAKLDRLSHDVHFINGLMSVTHLIETTAKLRMPHPW